MEAQCVENNDKFAELRQRAYEIAVIIKHDCEIEHS
jgi:hypothetical protein